jgi:hypothetical protein
MPGPNPLLVKTGLAGAAVDKFKILKFGTADDTFIHATTITEVLVAVSLEAAASGARLEYVTDGIATVQAGGTVTRGDFVTSGAAGVGVAAAPATTAHNGTIGIAMASAVIGDFFPVMICQARTGSAAGA